MLFKNLHLSYLVFRGTLFKKIEFKISNENAWEVGLTCGGEIEIYIEQIK